MPKRARKGAAARGGTNEREGIEVDLYAASRRTAVYHDVDAIVLHRRVQIFLHDGLQAVDFVDEQDVVGLQACQQSCQVARLVEHGAARKLEAHTQLIGDDVG